MVWLFEEETHRPIGVLDNYYVLRAVQRYDEHGELEIRAPASVVSGILKPGTVVWVKEAHQAYIVEEIEISPDESNSDVMIVTGYTASKLFRRRVVTESNVYSGTAGSIIQQLVDAVFSEEKRRFSRFRYNIPPIGAEMEYECEPMELDEAIMSLCKAGGIGFRSNFDLATRELTFELYQGVDRTGKVHPAVVFSPEYDNIHSIDYIDSLNAYKSIVYVLGEKKEKVQRMLEIVGEDDSSYARYEAVSEASKSRSVKEGESTRELSDAEYRDVLHQYGEEYLAKSERVTSCDGKVVATSLLYQLGVDYNIGDIALFRHARYGLQDEMRVREVENAFENGTHVVSLKLGNKKPTLIDKIKLKK